MIWFWTCWSFVFTLLIVTEPREIGRALMDIFRELARWMSIAGRLVRR